MNIIFNENYSNVRTMARNALRDHWTAVVLAMMIYSIFTSTLPAIISVLIPNAVISLNDVFPTAYLELYNQGMTDFSFVTTLYDFLLAGPFSLGLSFYLLKFLRCKETSLETIFEGFEFIIKAFLLQFMIYFFVTLWTFLFIIPGIIAAFRYSQAFFILADDPKKKVMDCINESKFMMNRNKLSLFLLQVTFIGWFILAQLIGSLLLLPFNFGNTMLSSILLEVVAVIVSIPIFAVSAYQNVTITIFYEIISGHLVQKRSQYNPFTNGEFTGDGNREDFYRNQNNTNNTFENNNSYNHDNHQTNNDNNYSHPTFTYIPHTDKRKEEESKKDDDNSNNSSLE